MDLSETSWEHVDGNETYYYINGGEFLWAAERLLTSQEGLCSVELFNLLVSFEITRDEYIYLDSIVLQNGSTLDPREDNMKIYLKQGWPFRGLRPTCNLSVDFVQPARVSFHSLKCVLTLSSSLKQKETSNLVEKTLPWMLIKYAVEYFNCFEATDNKWLRRTWC
jgi:hypothetical protein